MNIDQIRHVYPTAGDPHRTALYDTDSLACWCHPRVEIVRGEQHAGMILGLVVIHKAKEPAGEAHEGLRESCSTPGH